MCKRAVFSLFLGLGAVALLSAPAFAAPLDIRIAGGSDDAEQHLTAGMDVGSTDLELPYEDDGTPSATDEQLTCLRYLVPLAKGTKITKAYVEFTCDETKGGSRPVNLIIEGQLAVNPPAFTTAANDLTGRTPWTKTQVKWTVENWTTVGQKSRTPDLTAVIQEIIDQAGWAGGNALVLALRDDKSSPSTGIRCADAFEDGITNPLLHIEVLNPSASVPDPADGAVGVSMPLFGWTKGDGAIFHNVYFGTTPDLTEANLVAKNQPFPMYYHVPGLEPGLKYYWRVDEVDAAGIVTTGTVWSFSSPSQKAFGPTPKNNAKYIPVDAKLTWTAGHGAQSHTVYFGTTLDEANKASGGSAAVVPTYTPTAPLAKGTTYYWRVDESDGKNTFKGDVWSFTTMPDIKITNPDLVGWWMFEEGAGTKVVDFSGYGNDGTLAGGTQWVDGVVGGGVALTNGYMVIDGVVNDLKGTNLTLSAWIKTTQGNEGNVFAVNDAGSNYALLFGIQGGNPYRWDTADAQFGPAVNDNQWHLLTYVRDGGTASIYVDGVLRNSQSTSFSLSGMTRWSIGQEWDDATPSDFYNGAVDDIRVYSKALTLDEVKELMRGDPTVAWKPSPDNKATVDVIQVEQGLSWAAGENAKQHDVYLGTDKAAVTAATASDTTGIYRGRQDKTSFTPAEPLGWGTGPYYWRVDEVQNSGAITTGAVWSFSVANFLSVDNMESYTDQAGEEIFAIWIDGYTDGLSGSTVGKMTATAGTFGETTIVHGGKQSMPMDFNNTKSPYYSEATQTFAPLQDWTAYGVTDLSLWVRGNPVSFVAKGNEAFTVGASGHDIWDNADDFRFVYKRLNGNGSIVVKVESLVNTNAWAKAGVMIRETLDAGSTMAYMIESFSSGVSFGWRSTPNAACGSATQAGIVAPQWVKLTRTGNAFTAQYSADGKTWTDIKDAITGAVVSTPINMGASVYIGLCVTSHNTNATTTAELSGAATTGGVSGAWQQVWIGDDPDRTNGAAKLYVTVEDSAGKSATASDATLANTGAWTEWKIPLSSLTGVNLAKVKKLYIGVGDKKAPAPDGAGTIYVDDISLTKP